jgi:hypothetical protein
MNERIRELAQEAEVSRGRMRVVDIGKFAELIVRECAELMPQDNLYKMVLKHFGVEE